MTNLRKGWARPKDHTHECLVIRQTVRRTPTELSSPGLALKEDFKICAAILVLHFINPLVTNGFSHPYHLDESTFIFRGIRNIFSFLFHFSMKIMSANRIALDGMPRFAASHLGLICLPMSRKKDSRLIWVNLSHQNCCFIISNISPI